MQIDQKVDFYKVKTSLSPDVCHWQIEVVSPAGPGAASPAAAAARPPAAAALDGAVSPAVAEAVAEAAVLGAEEAVVQEVHQAALWARNTLLDHSVFSPHFAGEFSYACRFK